MRDEIDGHGSRREIYESWHWMPEESWTGENHSWQFLFYIQAQPSLRKNARMQRSGNQSGNQSVLSSLSIVPSANHTLGLGCVLYSMRRR